jgi:hypothetical protein
LQTLVSSAKLIPTIYSAEHPLETKPLGADEFLPIFIYILIKSKISNLLSLYNEISYLCDPDKVISETGYYLATLEASIEHLKGVDINNKDGINFFINTNQMDSSDDDSDNDDCDNDNIKHENDCEFGSDFILPHPLY